MLITEMPEIQQKLWTRAKALIELFADHETTTCALWWQTLLLRQTRVLTSREMLEFAIGLMQAQGDMMDPSAAAFWGESWMPNLSKPAGFDTPELSKDWYANEFKRLEAAYGRSMAKWPAEYRKDVAFFAYVEANTKTAIEQSFRRDNGSVVWLGEPRVMSTQDGSSLDGSIIQALEEFIKGTKS